MPEFESRQRITRTLRWRLAYSDKGQFAGGGIGNRTPHVENELWVQVMDDPSDEGPTGRLQLHLGSTRQALEELGVFLLALARYRPPEPGYRRSFDLTDRTGQPALNFIIHLPEDDATYRPEYSQIHVSARGVVGESGQVQDRGLPMRNENLLSTPSDELEAELARTEGRLRALRFVQAYRGNYTIVREELARAERQAGDPSNLLAVSYAQGLRDALSLAE